MHTVCGKHVYPVQYISYIGEVKRLVRLATGDWQLDIVRYLVTVSRSIAWHDQRTLAELFSLREMMQRRMVCGMIS